MEFINSLIGGKTVCVTCLGKSIEELEKRIELFRNKDIVWVGLGQFDIVYFNILLKIKHNFTIIFDTATVIERYCKDYEMNVRFPRIINFFKNSNNSLWITSDGMIRDSIKPYMPELLAHYGQKIRIVDELFPIDTRRDYMEVPNSLCLLLGVLLYGQAKQIIIFGSDGYKGDPKLNLYSYYKPELVRQERMAALGQDWDEGINRDTVNFAEQTESKIKLYSKYFKHSCPIYNCSPSTYYTYPQRITYDELESIT